jgi:endonuclease/exonuclease/phosphatase family metal-dependent hydrolase
MEKHMLNVEVTLENYPKILNVLMKSLLLDTMQKVMRDPSNHETGKVLASIMTETSNFACRVVSTHLSCLPKEEQEKAVKMFMESFEADLHQNLEINTDVQRVVEDLLRREGKIK